MLRFRLPHLLILTTAFILSAWSQIGHQRLSFVAPIGINNKSTSTSTPYYVEVSDSSEYILLPGCDYHKDKIDYSQTYDTCVVGAGLSGTVFAERTANMLGKRVLVIDKRPHIGGNCYDFVDPKTGIRRNQYGSHLFHTQI